MEYSLVHVRAKPEHVDDALGMIAADWSGEVIKPRPDWGDHWSTVRVTERTGSHVAPLLSEVLDAPVVAVAVAGERFSLSYWRPGARPIWADGHNGAAVKEVAAAFGKNPDSLRRLMQGSKPAANRHADVTGLLQLPQPVVTGYEPVFNGRQTIAPSQLPKATARVRRRHRARRIGEILALLEIVAFLAVDYFWFLRPSIWLVPALAFFVVNGIVLLVMRHRLRSPARLKS